MTTIEKLTVLLKFGNIEYSEEFHKYEFSPKKGFYGAFKLGVGCIYNNESLDALISNTFSKLLK